MQKFHDVALSWYAGILTPIPSGTVTVRNSLGNTATLYSDNGVTPIANPFSTGTDGEYSFYTANGRYSIEIAKAGYDSDTLTDVMIYDPVDDNGGGGGGGTDTPANGTYLVSGGGVAHSSALSVIVSSAVYVIQGVQYSSTQTTLTAATADGTYARIDVVAVNTSGHAVIITGTPAANPVKPDVNPMTQLELTFFLVDVGATVVPVTTVDLYHEYLGAPTEFLTGSAGPTFTKNSTNLPRNGTYNLEITNGGNSSWFYFQAPAPFDPVAYQSLVFYIRVKPTWPTTQTLGVGLYLWDTLRGGVKIFTSTAAYGFDKNNITDYQQIVVPMAQFLADGLSVNQIRIQCYGAASSVLGCYIDDVTLQSGVAPTFDAGRMRWRGPYSAATAYVINDVVLSGGIQYVCIAPATNFPPASSATYWQASTGATGVSLTTTNVWTKNNSVTPVALTDAANIATNAALSNVFTVTLGGNRTLDNPTNLTNGMVLSYLVTQDGTGSRTLAYGSKFKWGLGGASSAPALSTTAGAVDLISCMYHSASDTLRSVLLGAGASSVSLSTTNVWTKNQSVTPVSLTDGATISVDASLSNAFKVTLGGNRTLANPTNMTDGMVLNFVITQDGTGSRTLAYGSKYKWGLGGAASAPALSTTASGCDLVSCVYDSASDTLRCAMIQTGSPTTAGKHAIWIAAGSMSPSATGGCAALATIASAANQPDIQTLDFDTTTQEFAQFSITMPKSWNEDTVTFAPVWSHAATTTNFGVVWQLQGYAASNDDAIATAYGTEQTSTDTGGTTNDIYKGPDSAAITIAGTPAAEDTVFFRLARVPANGSDTMAIDARLHGIVLYITIDADTDA